MDVRRRPAVALVCLCLLLLAVNFAVTPRHVGAVVLETAMVGTGLMLGFCLYGIGYWMGGWKGKHPWFVCSHCLTPQQAIVPDGHTQVCPACGKLSSANQLDRRTLSEMVPRKNRGGISFRTRPHAVLFSGILLGLTGLVMYPILMTDMQEVVIQLGTHSGFCLGLRRWMFWANGVPRMPSAPFFGYGDYVSLAVTVGLILITASIYWYAGLLRSRIGMLLPLVVAAMNLAVNAVFFAAIVK
jgi:hypothetical protein